MDTRGRLEAALSNELKSVTEYCELAENVKDQTLQAILINIIGDKYGHARVLAALLINSS